MTEPAWNNLVEQLQDAEPKVRRRAIRRLAATRDPQVISLLRNVYLQEEDDRVRDAAEAALAQFRAQQQGTASGRMLRIGERALIRAISVLVVSFLALVAANVAVRALERTAEDPAGATDNGSPVLERSVLERDLKTRLAQVGAEVNRLRESDRAYRETGALACVDTLQPLAALDLSAATRQNYQADLTLIADRLDATLPFLQSAQMRWDTMCAAGQANMADVVRASAELDQVTVDLGIVERDLASAIANPAPTFGPSPTTTPTETPRPSPTATTTGLPASDAFEAPEAPLADAPQEPPTETPTNTETPVPSATTPPTSTPTSTPTYTPTPLPLPNLDYAVVIRELNRRLAVLGDLQRPYNNGMLDNWRRSQQGELISPNSCALDLWPGVFEWSGEERAQLDQPDTADPQLEATARLINEGLTLAGQARALYEPSCYNQTLAGTAAEGIPLATRAQESLTEAQQLVEEIRRRP